MSVAESEDPSALIARAVLRLARRLRGARPEKSVNLSTLALLTTLHRRGPMSAVQLARELGPGHVVATVAVDSGLKYLAGDLFANAESH